MKKAFLLTIVIACAMVMHARVIFLNTGGDSLWNQEEAVFFCRSLGGDVEAQEIQMTKVNDLVYKAEISDAHTRIIFFRMPKGAEKIDESSVLNRTTALTLSPDFDIYIITGLGEYDGAWSQADEALKREVKSNLPLEYNPEPLDGKNAQ